MEMRYSLIFLFKFFFFFFFLCINHKSLLFMAKQALIGKSCLSLTQGLTMTVKGLLKQWHHEVNSEQA